MKYASLAKYTTLEVQALLLVSDLEIAVKTGAKLPEDVIISMSSFRKLEQLEKGSNNFKVREMIEAIVKENSN